MEMILEEDNLGIADGLNARIDAADNLKQWGYGDGNYHLLQRLCGIEKPTEVWIDFFFTAKHKQICERLAGPNGYIILRVLAVRHGINLDEYKLD